MLQVFFNNTRNNICVIVLSVMDRSIIIYRLSTRPKRMEILYLNIFNTSSLNENAGNLIEISPRSLNVRFGYHDNEFLTP